MKFKIARNELSKILKFGDRIINENKINLINPTLSFLYLKIQYDKSLAICSNGITSGSYEINKNAIEIEEEGTILVRPKLLLNIISKLNDEDIYLSKVDDSILNVMTNNFSAQINIIDDSSYPSINFDYSDSIKFDLDSKTLYQIHQKVSCFSLNSAELSKILNGVLFDTETFKGFLTTISTDSYKLSTLKVPLETEKEVKFVLDSSVLKVIIELLKNEDKQIHFYLEKEKYSKNIFIQFDDILLLNKTIEGNYPTNIYNSLNILVNSTLKINRNELISSLERGQIFVSNDKSPIVKLCFNNKNVNIDFSSYELGSSQETVKLLEFEGLEVKTSLNSAFLISLLKVIETENVIFNFENGNKQLIIQPENNELFKQLLLPTKTR